MIVLVVLIFLIFPVFSEEIDEVGEAVPSFIIIGTQRGGSTALSVYLRQHPNLWTVEDHVKKRNTRELSFFSTRKYEVQGIEYYLSLFELARRKALGEGKQEPLLLFEKTPDYLFVRNVPERIFTHFPDVKMIVLLRNPVDRAYSEQNRIWYVRNGRGKRNDPSIDIHKKRKEVEDVIRSMLQIGKPSGSGLLERGNYYVQLEWYFRFFRRDQILILRSEDFFEDPRKIVDEVLTFLNVTLTEEFPEEYQFRKINTNNHLPMTHELRREMMDRFQDMNRKLYELVGRDFGWEELNERKIIEAKNNNNYEVKNEDDDEDQNFGNDL